LGIGKLVVSLYSQNGVMKEYIEFLIDNGFSEDEAKEVVEAISLKSFVAGVDNVTYDDYHGYSTKLSFDEWFDKEIGIEIPKEIIEKLDKMGYTVVKK
jgi:divalent metal cation (Fe/Co/Zn/Cd) transporter